MTNCQPETVSQLRSAVANSTSCSTEEFPTSNWHPNSQCSCHFRSTGELTTAYCNPATRIRQFALLDLKVFRLHWWSCPRFLGAISSARHLHVNRAECQPFIKMDMASKSSNSRPSAWKAGALPTGLYEWIIPFYVCHIYELCNQTVYITQLVNICTVLG